MNCHTLRCRSLVLLVALQVFYSAAAVVQAQSPAITSSTPQAARPGESVDVIFRGSNLAEATRLWTSFPGEVTLPADIADNGTKPGEVLFRMKLPADAPLGIHAVRLVTKQGVSNLKLFLVDDLPSITQVRGNQSAAAAQALSLPVAVDGYIDPLTRNYYKFTVAAGQRLSFEVLARRIGSPLDPMIRVLDATGRELTYSDDAPGLGSESQLSYTFREAGEYLLELRDIRYQGGANFQYRLRIGDFPCVTVPYPMAVQRGVTANLTFAGSYTQGLPTFPLTIPAEVTANWTTVGARLPNGQGSGFGAIEVSGSEQALEVEPNNTAEQSTRINLGAGVNGRLDQPGDVDRFVFTAKMGQQFTFTGITRSQGSPADLYLRLLKADGAEVAMADDAGTQEGFFNYTFPADGDYTLVVEDLNRRGGPEFAYRVAVTPFTESFQLSATADTLNIPRGGAVMLTVNATRGKMTGPIQLSLLDAPAGITAAPAVLGPGRNTVTMTLHCDPSLEPGQFLQVKVLGVTKLGDVEYKAIATATEAQKVAQGGNPFPPAAFAEQLAVGVAPAPLYVLSTSAPELVLGKDLSATITIKAARTADFTEEIALALSAAKDALPAGITATLKPIAKDTNEVGIVFAANTQAALGEFTVVLLGTGKKGNVTSVQPIPALKLSLQAPYTIQPDFAGGLLAKGQTLAVKVAVTRNPAFNGPIALTFENLPKGVTAAAASIPEGQSEATVVLTAAADAAVGAVKNVIVAGEGTAGAAKLAVKAAPAELKVE